MNFLAKIRMPQKFDTIQKQFFITMSIFFLGICMGVFSKYLDYMQAELPTLLQLIDNILDLHNFLGEFAAWIVIVVYISVYSNTPSRSAINVFLFFFGFIVSYYVYCYFVAGFFPKNYALIWLAFTILSPILAFITWYAKGIGNIAMIISSEILAVLLNTTFSYGIFYIDIHSWLDLLMLLFGIFILHKSKKETVIMIGIAIILAILMRVLVPFEF